MTTAPSSSTLPDIQSTDDLRKVAIDKVGVKDVKYPLSLQTRDNGPIHTVATINMYVALPHDQKGTHMSRFMELLREHTDASKAINPSEFYTIAAEIRDRLNAAEAHLEVSFPYFMMKKAPVTGAEGLMDYTATFNVVSTEQSHEMSMTVAVPATSLCPCSKEISEYGAHNQRCEITAKVWTTDSVWIEDIVEILEASASCEVYPVLKRADEKWVTERAYDQPKFVEDSIRDLAVALNADDRVTKYVIRSENFESIHNHNAFAEISREK